MSASASLIPELEDVIQNGSADRRATTVQRIANLFVDGAASFNEDHIGPVRRRALPPGRRDRGEGARRNGAVAGVTRQCADRADAHARQGRGHRGRGSRAVAVAALAKANSSRLARTRGQAHLAAIAGRADLGEAVTDVLVRRGNPEVVRTVADNQSAKFSEGGFSALVKRAEATRTWPEGRLAVRDPVRTCSASFSVRATMVVQQRLLASAKPETRAENPARAR